MRGFAADDAAERHAAAMTPSPADKAVGERKAERERNLERARHVDPLIGHVMGVELLDGAAGKLVDDVFVEARLDNENRVWTFACHCSVIPGSGGPPPSAHSLAGPRSCGTGNC